MKRGVKEAVFCPVQALILDHIAISLGKFDQSQWVGFEKGRGGGVEAGTAGDVLGVVASTPGSNSALKFSLENKNHR